MKQYKFLISGTVSASDSSAAELWLSCLVNKHPCFRDCSEWIEQPEFIGDPAVRERNDKWDKYLEQCDDKDLQQLMGTFQKRLQQVNQTWRKKRR